MDNSRNVIWTNESSFEVGKNLRLIQVWQRVYERYSWDFLCPTLKSSRASIMVWGAFSGYDKFHLVIVL